MMMLMTMIVFSREERELIFKWEFFQINFRISAANSEIGCLHEQKRLNSNTFRLKEARAQTHISLIVIVINGRA